MFGTKNAPKREDFAFLLYLSNERVTVSNREWSDKYKQKGRWCVLQRKEVVWNKETECCDVAYNGEANR